MSDDLLENAIVAAQDQYGDPPAKYAPGNNMPASVTVRYKYVPDERPFDHVLARSLGWVSQEDHDRRVTELLNANNKLIAERRLLETTTVDLIKTILRNAAELFNPRDQRRV